MKGIEGIKWVEPENMHLTIKFMGEVPDKLVEQVVERVSYSVHGEVAFNISFSILGGFPNLRRPRVLWIGVKEGKEKIVQLMTKLNEELAKLGFETESRTHVPHLTIGRVKKIQDLRLESEDFKTPSFLANRVYLIKSELTSRGPIYTDIKEFKLE